MSDRDFEIAGRKFKLSKINALEQFHIVRRITPILKALLPEVKTFQAMAGKELTKDEQMDVFIKIAMPVMDGLADLTDKDSERVLFGLLSSVEMQQLPAGNWARLANSSGLMFADLGLSMLLQGAGRAFAYNLAGFFAELPQGS